MRLLGNEQESLLLLPPLSQLGLSVAFAHVCSFLIPTPSVSQGCVISCHRSPICLLSGRSNGSAPVILLLNCEVFWLLHCLRGSLLPFHRVSLFCFWAGHREVPPHSMSCSNMMELWLLCALAWGEGMCALSRQGQCCPFLPPHLWNSLAQPSLSSPSELWEVCRPYLTYTKGFVHHPIRPLSYQNHSLFLCISILLPRIWKSSSEPVGWLSWNWWSLLHQPGVSVCPWTTTLTAQLHQWFLYEAHVCLLQFSWVVVGGGSSGMGRIRTKPTKISEEEKAMASLGS